MGNIDAMLKGAMKQIIDAGILPHTESATYWKAGAVSGIAVNIHVDRQPPGWLLQRVPSARVVVFLSRSASSSITQINEGDRLEFALRQGGATAKHPVRIIDDTASGWRLGV